MNNDEDELLCLDNVGNAEDTIEEKTPYDPHRTPRRIDYERLRAQYIIGKRTLHEDGTVSVTNYTLAELAKLHGVYLPLLKARSAKEAWSVQRAAYKARLQENAEATALNIYLHEGAVADTQAMIATNKLNKIYKMALSKYDDVIEAYDRDTPLPDDLQIDVKELKDLLAIGKELHTLSQNVVRSRSATVDPSLVQDLRATAQKRKLQRRAGGTSPSDTKAIEKRIANLQNILAPATPTVKDNDNSTLPSM